MGCLKKTFNQCQPRGYNFDHDGYAQIYSNYIVKVLLNNIPKTDLKYFSSLNNYRLAKICKSCLNGCIPKKYSELQPIILHAFILPPKVIFGSI